MRDPGSRRHKVRNGRAPPGHYLFWQAIIVPTFTGCIFPLGVSDGGLPSVVKQFGQRQKIIWKNDWDPLAILNEYVYLASSGETVPGIAMIIA